MSESPRQLLTRIYTQALLDEAPVSCLQPGAPGREGKAVVLAQKDVGRLFRAAAAAGLEVALQKPGAVQLSLDAEPARYVGSPVAACGRIHRYVDGRTACGLPVQDAWQEYEEVPAGREQCSRCPQG